MIKIVLIAFGVLFLINILVVGCLWRSKRPFHYSHLIRHTDDYKTDQPSICAIYGMGSLLDTLDDSGLEPTRIKPILDGGISITFSNELRRCCVEFDKDGDISVLFLGESTPITRYLSSNAALIRSIREFLEGVAV